MGSLVNLTSQSRVWFVKSLRKWRSFLRFSCCSRWAPLTRRFTTKRTSTVHFSTHSMWFCVLRCVPEIPTPDSQSLHQLRCLKVPLIGGSVISLTWKENCATYASKDLTDSSSTNHVWAYSLCVSRSTLSGRKCSPPAGIILMDVSAAWFRFSATAISASIREVSRCEKGSVMWDKSAPKSSRIWNRSNWNAMEIQPIGSGLKFKSSIFAMF